MRPMTLLNPILGGKIRGIITTLFAIWILVLQSYPALADQAWSGQVATAYALLVGAIQILTHATDVGGSGI